MVVDNHDTAAELQEFRLEQKREHSQIQKTLSNQGKALRDITKMINDIYPTVKQDIKKAEAYKVVGEDLKMKGSGWKFWMSLVAIGLSVVLAIRSFIK